MITDNLFKLSIISSRLQTICLLLYDFTAICTVVYYKHFWSDIVSVDVRSFSFDDSNRRNKKI